MTDQADIDYSQEFYPKPDEQVTGRILKDLIDYFPWPKKDWNEFIRQVLIEEKLPHEMTVDDRLRYYMVVAEAISQGQFHHIPYINGNFVSSDYLRFFRTVKLGLDPKGKNEETVGFTARLLSKTFKSVAILKENQKQDPKNPLHLILTARDPRAVRNDFSALFNSAGRPQVLDGPVVIQLPVIERPETVTRSELVVQNPEDTELPSELSLTAMQIALFETLRKPRKKESATGAVFKVNGDIGTVKYRISEDSGPDVKVVRVGEEELDISVIPKYPEAFVYGLLFPSARLFEFGNSREKAHQLTPNHFTPLLSNGWFVQETPSDFSYDPGKVSKIMSVLARGFTAARYDRPNVEKENLVRVFALNALAGECALKNDHPKLRFVMQALETKNP